MKPIALPGRQRGIALAVALILLVVLTLLALSGVRLSTMELRMSLNDQLRVESFERAQSMVDTTIRNFNNTPVLAIDAVLCARLPSGWNESDTCPATDPTCCRVRPSLTTSLQTNFGSLFSANAVNVIIRSIPPLNADPPVGSGYSLDKFDAAYLRVEGQYDQNSLGYGAARVSEGVAVVYGAAGEITTASGNNVVANNFDGATN